MTNGFENIAIQKKEEDVKKDIPKVDQGDAMESFIKREYDTDIKTPEERQGDAMESFLEREYGEDNRRENDQQQEEKNKIYEKIENDPAIESIKTEILKRTNQEVKEAQEGKQGGIASRESSGQNMHNFWDRVYGRVAMQQWDIFISQYPEKAQAYKDKIVLIKDALDRQEERKNKQKKEDNIEKKENSKEIFNEIESLERDRKLEKLKEINSDLKSTLEKMVDSSTSQKDFRKIISDFNDANMKEREGRYNSVDLDDGRITVKYYENGSISISGNYKEKKSEIKNENSKEDIEEIEMSDLEDKELIRLSNEMKKAREKYDKNTEKTASAWEKIKNVFPKLVLGENATSVKEAEEYLNRYKEARNNLLKYQTEKLKKINLPKEKRIKEVADLAKHYNENEQFDSLDKETGERFNFSEEKKVEEKTVKIEKNKKKLVDKIFEKYKISEKDNYYEKSSIFIDKLMREVAMGHYENWKNSKDKKMNDLIDEKGKPKDKIGENIQKMEKYFKNILGEKAQFQQNETVKQWIVRIIKESLEANK